MKVLIVTLSFLFCLPATAQDNNAAIGIPYHKNPNKVFSMKDNKSQSVIDELNKYDVKYYGLNLNVSKYITEISGDATIYAQVMAEFLDTLYLQLIDTIQIYSAYMIVDSVKINEISADYSHNNNVLKIYISPPIPADSYFYAKIYYHGNGNGPIYNDYIYNVHLTYTAAEVSGAYFWFPCKQLPDDKADSSRMIITTDSDCLAGSNGILSSVQILPNNKTCYEWKSTSPIAFYLISFAVGQYIEYKTYMPLNNSNDSLLIDNFLCLNDPNIPTELVAIEKTKDNIHFFSDLFGPYPFKNEKYGCSVGRYGGMENQTLSALSSDDLDTTMHLYNGWYYWVSAHELAHQWFGDNVTCATWQDIWVNEGFAEYCEYLAIDNNDSHQNGITFLTFLQNKAKFEPQGSVYVPDEHAFDPNWIFNPYLSYCKGAAILHTIRFIVNNDSLFFQSLKNYQTKFAGGSATGLDFKAVLDSTTGMDFTDFFNEWYFGQGFPTFNIYYYQQNDSVYFHSVQTASSTETPLFKIPVELKLIYNEGDTTIRYNQYENDKYFTIPVNHQITQVVFDPNHWLVANSFLHLTSVEDDNHGIKKYNLAQNYPNPFNPTTTIKYQVPEISFVTLKVYDVLGGEIETLVNEEKQTGTYELTWNATNLSSGIFFYQIRVGDFIQTKKMMLLK